jgi:hypothetical protein
VSNILLEWREANSLADFGELTVAWLKGTLKYHPADGDSPDYETNEIVEDLVQLNRRGFVTTFSQPGVSIDESGSGQRATVEGFTSEPLARAIGAWGLHSELLVFVYEPSAEGGYQVPITTSEFHPFTWCGPAWGEESFQGYDDVCSLEGLAALRSAWTVVVIDPKWGRKHYLWNQLRQATTKRRSKDFRWSIEPSPDLDLNVDFIR